MSETEQSHDDTAPPEPGFAARCGEKILGWWDALSSPAASLLSREEAVWQGFWAAVGRVLLGGVLVGGCILLSMLYGSGARLFSRMIDLKRDTGADAVLLTVIWLIAAGATLIISWTDWDRKWRILSWLCFTLVAAGTLMHSGTTPVQLAVLAGQFGIHWFIFAALETRDRRAAWERELASAERRAARVLHTELLQRYRGHAGFPEDPVPSREDAGPP